MPSDNNEIKVEAVETQAGRSIGKAIGEGSASQGQEVCQISYACTCGVRRSGEWCPSVCVLVVPCL